MYDVLDGFSLEVHAGKIMAVIGQPGCGSSNIPMLLKRWYRASQGTIEIDGVNIDDYDSSFNLQVGLVGEPVIFRGTVFDNIAYGVPHMHVMAATMAAKFSDAHRFIMQLPDEYKTVIGVGGLRLSPAQSTRIALARTMAQNPPIVVLDDPLANLDETSAGRVRNSIKRMTRTPIKRTVILISQRVEETAMADIVTTMANGKVVETGPREILLKDESSKYNKFLKGKIKAGRPNAP